MQFNIYALVLLFACLQGMIYALLLVMRGKKEERTSDYWLAGVIVSACLFNMGWMLGFMGIHILGQEWWFLPQSVDLIIGPLVYYYLKSQINSEWRFTRADFRHFLPYSLYFVYHLVVFSFGPGAVEWWNNHVHSPFHLYDLENIAGNISPIIYIILSWRLYRNYLQWLPHGRSDTDNLQFSWYRNFLIAMMAGIISGVALFIISYWVDFSFWDIWIQRALIAVIIYYISIAGYHTWQPRQLLFNPVETVLIADVSKKGTPNYHEDLPDLPVWKARIEEVMHTNRLYLQPELSLAQIAALLNTNPTQVSNVINAAFGKNFNDFVNSFRVTEFQEKINDPKLQHLSLLGIAFECGFNSKSTFNRAVKKITGKQPSDFIKN